jgi:signal transduction histidine kinase/HAMP domain-containing protein/type II secretory pathway pseudopilin PulG
MALRSRILLTLLPLLALLAVVGGAAAVLLYRLGGSIDLILRENYASVVAMQQLNESLERIDSSFQFALAGEETKARDQYGQNWPPYEAALQAEQRNITILPREQELADELAALTTRYRRQGDNYYNRPAGDLARRQLYFGGLGQSGLLQAFQQIKDVSGQIRGLNQDNMVGASRESRKLAGDSLFWFGIGMAVAVLLAFLLAFHTIRTILRPIQAMTHSALAIGAGNLDQVIPVTSRDELGQLANAFNTMGRQLRLYRQTGYSRLLRAQRTSQATIDSFPDPVVVLDSERRLEMANPAARRLLGVVPPPADAQVFLPWQPPKSLQTALDNVMSRRDDYLPEDFDQAVTISCDGRPRLFLPRILAIRDPQENILGAAVLLQDVTRFQLLDQVKSNLVATVSHELKTPLTSIGLAVHLLLEEAAGPLTAKQTELLIDARENSERLLATINNLLDLTRFEGGRQRLDLRPRPPAELLEAAANVVRPRVEDKQITIEVHAADTLPPVDVDVPRFAHALDNLVDNAIAYTRPGGRIVLSAATVGSNVALTVSDTGVGIPAEYLPRVFERFFQVPGRNEGRKEGRKEGRNEGRGTGLGLAIVREIVAAHGGTITCESTPSAGTTFTIMLPASNGQPADAPRAPDTWSGAEAVR